MSSPRIIIKAVLVWIAASLFCVNIVAAQTFGQYQGDISSFNRLPQNTGGNTIYSNGAYQFQWPGVYFEARFKGPRIFFKISDDYNRFRVSVDSTEIFILEKPNEAVYEISDLGQGVHTIRIDKLSESQNNAGSFFGFYTQNIAQQMVQPQRSRKIEFIGDSYTVGYGNLSSSRACPGKLFQNTDNTKAFGQIVARHFNADFQINAYSGIGMARNYNNNMGDKTIGHFYDRAIFSQDTTTSVPTFVPNIVFIALGTNDFSTPIKSGEKWNNVEELTQEYIEKYLLFLGQIRAKNSEATIIIAANLGANQKHLAALEAITKDYATRDNNFHFVLLPLLQNTGCDWHPNLNDHLAMAQIIVSKINDLKIKW